MRQVILLFTLLVAAAIPALGQGMGFGAPNVRIGINFPVFPQFQQVPNYPVYYAPQVDSNYFFYDGMYWVFVNDNWYASSWYNGPWALVSPMVVPVYILRVPVHYYREPPVYFRGYRLEGPPPWANHWGNDWQRQRTGWDHWNRNAAPPPAPLPIYQQQYSGRRYPSLEQQRSITNQNYNYQPRDPVVREHFQQVAAPMLQTIDQHDQRARTPHEAPQSDSPHPPPPVEPPHQPPPHEDRVAPPPEAQHPEPLHQLPSPLTPTPRTGPPNQVPPHQTQQPAPGVDHGPAADNGPKPPKPDGAREDQHDNR